MSMLSIPSRRSFVTAVGGGFVLLASPGGVFAQAAPAQPAAIPPVPLGRTRSSHPSCRTSFARRTATSRRPKPCWPSNHRS